MGSEKCVFLEWSFTQQYGRLTSRRVKVLRRQISFDRTRSSETGAFETKRIRPPRSSDIYFSPPLPEINKFKLAEVVIFWSGGISLSWTRNKNTAKCFQKQVLCMLKLRSGGGRQPRTDSDTTVKKALGRWVGGGGGERRLPS